MTAAYRRFPAEWEAQSAIMLTWPHRDTDWRDDFEAVEQCYLEIAQAILREQNLLISCEDQTILERVQLELDKTARANGTRLYGFCVPANDTWARDHGPIAIEENSQTVLLDFVFNAWGDKFSSSKDDAINGRLHSLGAFGDTSLRALELILEGGSIDSNGDGILLTTEHCLMQSTRNSKLDKLEIEQQLKELLGVELVLWLRSGYLEGDDTDAHIDTLARFVDASTICHVACNDPTDSHFRPLQNMRRELEQMSDLNGNAFNLVELPMPEAIYENGERLPATYANFLITNHSVLLPVYNVSEDQSAISILQDCFPERKIVPINCRALIRQHGSLHCITMQLLKGICE